jgi:hypothetical protein
VIERKRRRAEGVMPGARSSPFLGEFGAAFAYAAMLLLASCATTYHENLGLSPTSIQTLQYYPFQVKGYQKSFPDRRIVVLTSIDARTFKDAGTTDHASYQGYPAIGVVLDRHAQVAQRLYGPLLGPLLTGAIAQSAQEAGMTSSILPLALREALNVHGVDYVLMVSITGLWVVKQRGAESDGGAIWFSAAEVALDVTIYKPPFSVPFWQGISAAEYNDPPKPVANSQPEDETEIYDQPGEVLSVALTRAVAGIFRHEDLRTLVLQDAIPPR